LGRGHRWFSMWRKTGREGTPATGEADLQAGGDRGERTPEIPQTQFKLQIRLPTIENALGAENAPTSGQPAERPRSSPIGSSRTGGTPPTRRISGQDGAGDWRNNASRRTTKVQAILIDDPSDSQWTPRRLSWDIEYRAYFAGANPSSGRRSAGIDLKGLGRR